MFVRLLTRDGGLDRRGPTSGRSRISAPTRKTLLVRTEVNAAAVSDDGVSLPDYPVPHHAPSFMHPRVVETTP